jgi:regulation of enolase protein 1 (concanavalin A-like superfamily)
VTVNGKTLSDSYAVKVMPDLKPASITVNGKKIQGFTPDVHSYSYLVSSPSAKVPQVTVVSPYPEIAVDVIQAKAVPGTAVISLTDKVTVEKNTYLINFGTKSVSDEFNKTAAGPQWLWIRGNPANWSLTKKAGTMTITSAKGDLQAANNNAENLLLQSANTDWTIDTKVLYSRKPAGFSQNGGVIAYQDDDNYLKLVYGAGGAGRMGFGSMGGPGSVMLATEEDGHYKANATLSMANVIGDDNTLWLRLVKKGSLYTASVSADGRTFRPVGSINMLLKDIKAGLMVCEGAMDNRFARFGNMPGMQQPAQPDSPFEVSYDYFNIKNTGK